MSRIIKGPVRAGSSLMPGGAFNRSGRCIGETHRHARLSDEAVDAMRTLAQREGLSLARLARLFHCGKSTVRDIVVRRTRDQQTAMGRPVVHVSQLNLCPVLIEALVDYEDDWPRPVAPPLPALPPTDGACTGACAMQLMVWFLVDQAPWR